MAGSLPAALQLGLVDVARVEKVDLSKKRESSGQISQIPIFCCGGVICGFVCVVVLDYYLHLPRNFCERPDNFKMKLFLPEHTFKFVLAHVGLLVGFYCGIKN